MTESELHFELNEIMSNYERLFVQRAYAITRNLEDARDVVQDAFIKYIKFRSNGGEVKNSKNWFYMVIRNTAIDLLRKRSKKEQLVSQEKEAEVTFAVTPTSGRSPDKELQHREDVALSVKLLATLTAREESVIKMKIYQDFSYKEIAEKHDISVSNVGVTICNALKKLRRKVSNQSVT